MGIYPRTEIECGRFWSSWVLFLYSSNWSGLTHILPLRLLWLVSTTLLQVPLPSWLWYHCRRNLGWRNEWIWKDEFGASSVFNISWQGGLAPKDLGFVTILVICTKTMSWIANTCQNNVFVVNLQIRAWLKNWRHFLRSPKACQFLPLFNIHQH